MTDSKATNILSLTTQQGSDIYKVDPYKLCELAPETPLHLILYK